MSPSKRSTSCLAALGSLALLAACHGTPEHPVGDQGRGRAAIDPRPGADEVRYQIEPLASWAHILVRRDGPLARFGHDHAIVARPENGFVIWSGVNPAAGRARFTVDVRSLEVDPAEARAAHSLDTEPDADDIAATRNNMLEQVFDTGRWPQIDVAVWFSNDGTDPPTARAELGINGVPGEVEFPLALSVSGSRLEASGSFRIRQQDWGLTPFSILGGGLRVADQIEVHFAITAEAEKEAPPEAGPLVRPD